MTEAEWLACEETAPMLDFLRGRASERKLRLFACACFRLRPDTLNEKSDREVVKLAELYAEGLIGGRKLARFVRAGWGFVGATPEFRSINRAYQPDAIVSACVRVFDSGAWGGTGLAGTLREVFGSPFGEARFDRHWLTAPVLTLARQSYLAQDFAALPILADALEDAGCTDAAILSHLRSPGPHVRGCWALDLILGKQ